jgi:hypothetical protein
MTWRAVLSGRRRRRRLEAHAGVAAWRRHQHVEQAVLGGVLGQRALGRDLALALLLDGDVDEVAHDRVDVLADVADLGELGRLDLDEGRVGQPGQPARDLGLADAGRADHQDVLGRDLGAQFLVDALAPPAVAQRDRDGALGVLLADDVAVELGDDLLRGHGHGVGSRSGRARRRGAGGGERKSRPAMPESRAQSSVSMVCVWLV